MGNQIAAVPARDKVNLPALIGVTVFVAGSIVLMISLYVPIHRPAIKTSVSVQAAPLIPPCGITHGPDGFMFWSNYQKVDYVTAPSTHSRLVAAIIGGNVGEFLINRKSCGGRLSWALDESDFKIPEGPGAWANNDNRQFGRFFLSAHLMRLYLNSIWGKPNFSGRFYRLPNGDPKWLDSIGLHDGVGIFASDGHVGVLKKGYKDPYFADQGEGEVYFLRFSKQHYQNRDYQFTSYNAEASASSPTKTRARGLNSV